MFNYFKYGILSVFAVAPLQACTNPNSPTNLPAGEYSCTTESTNSKGTDVNKKTDTNVYYYEHGNKRAVETTKTTRDPDGLFNKETSTTTKKY